MALMVVMAYSHYNVPLWHVVWFTGQAQPKSHQPCHGGVCCRAMVVCVVVLVETLQLVRSPLHSHNHI